MTPYDFIKEALKDQYNLPSGEIGEALNMPIQIYSSPIDKWDILSYYYNKDKKCMVLEIIGISNIKC